MPEHGVKKRESFPALIALGFRLLTRRFALYVAATLVAFVLQAAVAVVWHVPHGVDIGSAIVLPILTTLVYAFVWIDSGDPQPAAVAWERFLERAWAVIIIDYVFGQLAGFALALSLLEDAGYVVVGIIGCALCTLLVFADVAATFDDDVTVWWLIPKAFQQSIITAWNAITFSRALALFSIVLLFFAIETELAALLTQRHIVDATFWGLVPLQTIATPPLAALTALVYRDATAPAKQAGSSCSG